MEDLQGFMKWEQVDKYPLRLLHKYDYIDSKTLMAVLVDRLYKEAGDAVENQ